MQKILTKKNSFMFFISVMLFVSIMFSLAPVAVFAESETIPLEGIVTGPDGNPVSGATVTLSNGTTLTTDANGYYSTNIAKDASVNVTVSKTGFNTRTINGVSYSSSGNAFWKPRKPTFSFTFDDGTETDANVKELFDSYGLKCGFAIVANRSDYSDYLDWEEDGFEILSHSTDGLAMSGFSSDQHADDAARVLKMTEAKRILTEAGFKNVRSWVAPSSVMRASILDDVLLTYDYAFGFKAGTTATNNFHTPATLPSYAEVRRYSVESNTPENVIKTIDDTIAQNGFLAFYAHKYPDSTKLTEENAKAYLDYLKPLADAGKIDILTPSEAADKYFKTVTCDVQLIDAPVMGVCDVNATLNSLNFKVNIEALPGEAITGKVFAALYGENNKLITATSYDAASVVDVSFDTQGDFAKVFWWNGQTLEPFTDAVTITGLPGEPEEEEPEEPVNPDDYTYHPETAYSQYALLWSEDFTDKTALDTYDPTGVNTTGPFSLAGGARSAMTFKDSFHKNITGDDANTLCQIGMKSNAAIRGIKGTGTAKAVTMSEGVFEFDTSFCATNISGKNHLVIGGNLYSPGSSASPSAPNTNDFTNGFRMYFEANSNTVSLEPGGGSAVSFTSPIALPFVNVSSAGASPNWARLRFTLIPKENDATKTVITAYIASYTDGKRSGTLGEYQKIGSVEMETELLTSSSRKADTQKWSADALGTSVAAGADNEVDSVIRFYGANASANWAIDNIKYYGPIK